MNYNQILRPLIFLILFSCFVISCKKSSDTPRCEEFREKMMNNDKEAVKKIITRYIDGLSSQKYTAQNLHNLLKAISRQCGIQGELLCYDCIETLPTQSEIVLRFSSPTIAKVIDISYTNTNTMKFVNMHE
jgi:hypothetical protein